MTHDELEELSKEMNSQDNLATLCPLYCVFEKEYIWGMDSNYSDQYKWIDACGEKCDSSDEGAHKIYYVLIDRFVNAHFTMKAAKQYIKENRHNLTKPCPYVMSLYRCHEMIKIQEHLKS